jgi:uridine kinase
MRPLVIGIAGGTGSGKSTVARNLAAGLPAGVLSLLDHDSYYRDRKDLPFAERAQLNYDHPDSLETELLVEHLTRLRNGEAVEVPMYDFTTHTRRIETRRIEPTPVIVVEGILVLQNSALRSKLDIKIFVDTDPDIRVFRRIRRDLEQRGRSFDSVRDQYYSTVRPMHLTFVEPSRRWADLIIPEGGENRIALDLIIGKLKNVLATNNE